MIESMLKGRVKLKNHVYFGSVPDGLLFDAGDSSFVLKDPAAYPVVEKLIALIDAGTPLALILERAPEKVSTFFRRILTLLAEHHMLLPVEESAPAAERLVAHHAPNELRKFLEDKLTGQSVDAALRRWREAPVLVLGSGQALLSTLRALADSGCQVLSAACDGGSADGLALLRDEIAHAHGVTLAVHRAPDEQLLASAAVLVYASDAGVTDAIERVEQAMRSGGIAGAIGAVIDGRACVLPAALPGHPGLHDVLHWLPPQDDSAAGLGPLAMSLLGCVTAHAALCRFFHVEAASIGRQVAIVSPLLEVTHAALVACAHGAQAVPSLPHPVKYQVPEWRPLFPFERVKYALEPWFDPLLGPFSVAADDQIEQVPLMQYPIRVRSASTPGQQAMVVGWGLDHASAVLHGLSQAIEALVETFMHHEIAPVCAFDEADWQRRALAYAIAHSEEMVLTHQWAWVDPARLPPGPVRVLHALLQFHAPQAIAIQLQWNRAGDAHIVRVFHADTLLSCVVAADALGALAEGLGQACSMFQLQKRPHVRFARNLVLPPVRAAERLDDWEAGLRATPGGKVRRAAYRLASAPGLPDNVYCGHAVLVDAAEDA